MLGVRLVKAKTIAKRRVSNKISSSPGFYHAWSSELGDYVLNEEWVERDLHTARKTNTRCSCWMCGNPRKYFGQRTIQELRAPSIIEEW